MSSDQVTTKHNANRREMMLSIFASVFFDVILAMVAFVVAKNSGASDTTAYFVSMVGPLLGLGFEFIRHRRLDGVAITILAIIGLQLLISLIGSTDPKVLLLKDSVFTGGLGLVLLASLTPLFRRPLLFYMGRKFGTDGTEAGLAYWDSLWQFEGFRHSQRMITGVWGTAYVIEAIAKAGWVLALPFDTAYFLNQLGPLLVTAALMGWTVWYAMRARKAGQAREAAAAAG